MKWKNTSSESNSTKKSLRKTFFYRLSQLVAFLLGARIFMVALLAFALYVSTFFLFNQEESLRDFVFDYKVHGIILCALLSILAGGLINQFYDQEKDHIIRPFRSSLQRFLKQKYVLYSYLALNLFSLSISWVISYRVFVFFLVYQFFIWFYSHKLSRILILNNLTFVGLTLYPFFGLLVYYQTFSVKVLFMAVYLFFILLVIDGIKDLLTKKADQVFGYQTVSNVFGLPIARVVLRVLMIFNFGISLFIIRVMGFENVMVWYFVLSLFTFAVGMFLLNFNHRSKDFYALNLYRIWLFIGIVFMLFDGIHTKY